MPSTGKGQFDAWYQPPVLWTNVNVRFTFEPDDAWTPDEEVAYGARWKTVVQDVWKPGIFTFRCQRPCWETLRATVVPDFTVVADAPQYEITVNKQRRPGATDTVGRVDESGVGHGTLHEDSLDPKTNTLPPGSTTAQAKQRPAAHEAGHMLGLGDSYLSPDLRAKGVNEKTPLLHAGLAKEQFGDAAFEQQLGKAAYFGTDDRIMSAGERVGAIDSAIFREALEILTGINEWVLDPVM
jgi:hypothetical protein